MESMKNKIIVKAETTSYSYVTLHNAAHYALEDAKNSEHSRFFNALTAMLYSAFSLEAYLNHLGNSEFQNWEKIERSKSPKQKLDMLVDKRGFVPDYSKKPFDVFDEIFKFRKKIVHGKTEHLKIEEVREGEIGDTPETPMTSWEKSTTLENAISFVEGSAEIITELHPIFGYKSHPFATEYRSSWEVKSFGDNS